MEEYNVPEAEPDTVPSPPRPDKSPPIHPKVPPESRPRAPAEPATPEEPHPVPLPPKGPA